MAVTDADKGALKYIIKAAMIMDDIFHLQVVLGSILAISLYTCLGSQVSQEKPTLFICTSSPMGFRSTEVVVPNIYIVSNSNR